MDNTLFRNALALARSGFPVIPLRPGAKEPLGAFVPRGAYDGSVDAEAILRWWSLSPGANIGATLAGRVIIDQDDRNGGDVSLHALETRFGPLPRTWRSLTAGGEHYWFDLSDGANIRGGNDKLGLGLDVKTGSGAYVVTPPSLHPLGVRYEWRWDSHPAETPRAVAPGWLVEILTPSPPPRLKPFRPLIDDDQRIADALMRIPADDRETWWRVGAALKSRFGESGRALWDEWSAKSAKFDEKTQARVWRSFRGHGVSIASIFHFAKKASAC